MENGINDYDLNVNLPEGEDLRRFRALKGFKDGSVEEATSVGTEEECAFAHKSHCGEVLGKRRWRDERSISIK